MKLEKPISQKMVGMQRSSNESRCPYCGSTKPRIWVHGHGQCAECGINIQECCQGETCEPEVYTS